MQGFRFDTTCLPLHGSLMHPVQFEQSVVSILQKDRRFHPHAYFLLKDALDFTLKRIAAGNGGQPRHVSCAELLIGFRDFALEQFGPMASTLLREWGVTDGSHVGDMVFLLIEEQVFGKQESDAPEDFHGVINLIASLQEPFLPKKIAPPAKHSPHNTVKTPM